ncbi:MAG: hypothetical protein ABRQ39_06685 [Candidatus Eremiobacterota bacterium]
MEPFKSYCPVCGGEDCPTYLGFYCRQVVDEKGTYYESYRILRFKCNRKGKKKPRHRTFSLLPFGLIPYSKYSTGFIMKILRLWLLQSKSIKEVIDYISELDKSGVLCTGPVSLYSFLAYILNGIEKLFVCGHYRRLCSLLNSYDRKTMIKNFFCYLEGKFDGKARDPCVFGYNFYRRCGGYRKNSHFLFGTPSQFRS